MATLRRIPPDIFSLLPAKFRRQLLSIIRPKAFRTLQNQRQLPDGQPGRMAPFDSFQAIFIHIPKCAGTSVSQSLFGQPTGGHSTVRRYQLIYTPEEFKRYYKFTFVRNPWDRFVSTYHYLEAGGKFSSDKRWFDANFRPYGSFRKVVLKWLTPSRAREGRLTCPQFHYLCTFGSKPKVNFVGRFENLENDFETVCSHLGIKARLPKMNRNPKRSSDYRSYYDDDTINKIATIYKKDIEYFGYTFE